MTGPLKGTTKTETTHDWSPVVMATHGERECLNCGVRPSWPGAKRRCWKTAETRRHEGTGQS